MEVRVPLFLAMFITISACGENSHGASKYSESDRLSGNCERIFEDAPNFDQSFYELAYSNGTIYTSNENPSSNFLKCLVERAANKAALVYDNTNVFEDLDAKIKFFDFSNVSSSPLSHYDMREINAKLLCMNEISQCESRKKSLLLVNEKNNKRQLKYPHVYVLSKELGYIESDECLVPFPLNKNGIINSLDVRRSIELRVDAIGICMVFLSQKDEKMLSLFEENTLFRGE